ncbi:GumC family protein [Edaphobacter bradus]|uniref:GumC family protein n=1 Tax=Edaphobacter bradus TaxID=2259016 RepID=UPI0021E037F9|nr:Wzz/FepE/Etk N-terminal domain-containing protein [Edaphobacter bradus]
MLGHRVLTLQDYTAILKRRWWVIVVPMLLLALVGFTITFFVQPVYVSQTLVLIEQQKVPDDYVKPVVSEDLNARLSSMQEQILSRSRLQPIIERFNLYGANKLGMDERIEKVRKDIDIKPIQSQIARANGLPGFFISFKAGDPHTAQSVCSEITSLFLSQNLRDREQSAMGTTDFLKGQLEDAKRNLDDQDAKLADFQRTYMGKLPGDESTSMNMLMTLNTQLDATTQALSRMEQDKSYGETILAQQVRELQAPQTKVQPQVQQAELQQLQTQEADLTARYTDDYPDVVAVRRKIKDLRAEMEKAPATQSAAPTVSGPEPASIQQLRAQLHSLDMGIAQKKRDQAKLQDQIAMYQNRIQASPMVQEQYKNLTRDYQTAQTFYDDLLKKMNQSKMATDLERRQQGEQFKVMDAPNLPEAPTSPNRAIFLGGGLLAGALLGLLVSALLEYRNTEVRSERDIWAFTKLPTLAVIAFTEQEDMAGPKRRFGFGRRKPTLTAGSKPAMSSGS